MRSDGAGDGIAVAVEGLTIAYGPTVVLDGIRLQVSQGTAVALVGDNGAGKSTLLRCVAGLQAPDDGHVRVFGHTPGDSVDFWTYVAATVESPSWYHGLTVREHLELVRVANGENAGDGVIDDVCGALGLDGLDGSLPGTLSSGQRQRFLLAATLVRPSRLLLLDEPEQRLDTAAKRAVAARLRAYVAAQGTVLMASHDEEFLRSIDCRVVTIGGRHH